MAGSQAVSFSSPVQASAAVLEALRQKGESYGAEIVRHVAEHGAGLVTVGRGGVYGCLRDLVGGGLAQQRTEMKPPKGYQGPPRVLYRLTATGKKAGDKIAATVRAYYGAGE